MRRGLEGDPGGRASDAPSHHIRGHRAPERQRAPERRGSAERRRAQTPGTGPRPHDGTETAQKTCGGRISGPAPIAAGRSFRPTGHDVVGGPFDLPLPLGEPFEGEGYYVTEVRHRFDLTTGLRTEFAAQRATLNEVA